MIYNGNFLLDHDKTKHVFLFPICLYIQSTLNSFKITWSNKGKNMDCLEKYFEKFRNNIIGNAFEHTFTHGKRSIIYADWAASGRLYRPIEEYITNTLGPFVANTHTETTLTGTVMTNAYHQAHKIIKNHVNAGPADCLLFAGYGMTAVVNKFQRILGLRVPEHCKAKLEEQSQEKPLIIITHMEHHSNQTTWVVGHCDVEIINRADDGLPDLNHLREILQANKNRNLLIGSFSACSNVTGILTPFHEMAAMMHEFGGYCFVDFSASAPYVKMDMHPQKDGQHLDAIFFSPHKFLGGPGASGVLVFTKELYKNKIPDHPGGGTVTWTDPWGGQRYFDDIEIREDGGTPGFLQAIKASLAILLKEEMGIENMAIREHELKERFISGLNKIPSLTCLEEQQHNRLGYISFFVKDIHHNLIVRLLNERFGIQARGGCSCAGTYGHILFNIDYHESQRINHLIDKGDMSKKPGWVRVSLHPTMTNDNIDYILASINKILENHKEWEKDYTFDIHSGDFIPKENKTFTIDLKDTFEAF